MINTILENILPKQMIIQVVNCNDNIFEFYFTSEYSKINFNQLRGFEIISFHPLILKNESKIFHIKKMNSIDFVLLDFLLNSEEDFNFNANILKNFFVSCTRILHQV